MQLIWDEFLKIIKEEAGSQVVETWFKAVYLKHWEATTKTVILQAPNQFVCNWIKNHYLNLIKTHLTRLLHTQEIKVEFTTLTQNEEKDKKNIFPAAPLINQKQETKQISSNHLPSVISTKNNLPTKKNNVFPGRLNGKYTFDSFVVGPCNSLAHAAAYAVSQNLGRVYNPLFIYGGTGLGKTHLLHAIGNEVKKNMPNLTVYYETSDNFINNFINSIRFDKHEKFRQKYQNLDLFLLDDIQFFSNKKQTQESFFHIFNLLFEQKKQIVFSSDTFPQEIAGLQNRLKSRLECGLVADIQTPDIETKIAILKKKADLHNIPASDDILELIASKSISNIRELEGALIRVGAFASLTNQPLTYKLAQKVLINFKENGNEQEDDTLILNKILKILSKHYSVSIPELRSHKRSKNIAAVRQISFYLMKKLTFCSLKAIGDFVGGRDHSTVIHAIDKIEKLIQQDPQFAKKLKIIEEEISLN